MGHYDEYYTEMANQSRELIEKRQSNCKHDWVPVRCDETGKSTQIKCLKCQKVKDL